MAFKVIAIIVCKKDYGSQFTKGKCYEVYREQEICGRLWYSVIADDTGHNNGWTAENFILLPDKSAVKLLYGK